MKGNLGWCVVIGKTRMENFSKPREWPIGEPDLSHVGKMVVGSDTHPALFKTRREARAEAKRRAKNQYWRYHPKKVGPIHNC